MGVVQTAIMRILFFLVFVKEGVPYPGVLTYDLPHQGAKIQNQLGYLFIYLSAHAENPVFLYVGTLI